MPRRWLWPLICIALVTLSLTTCESQSPTDTSGEKPAVIEESLLIRHWRVYLGEQQIGVLSEHVAKTESGYLVQIESLTRIRRAQASGSANIASGSSESFHYDEQKRLVDAHLQYNSGSEVISVDAKRSGNAITLTRADAANPISRSFTINPDLPFDETFASYLAAESIRQGNANATLKFSGIDAANLALVSRTLSIQTDPETKTRTLRTASPHLTMSGELSPDLVAASLSDTSDSGYHIVASTEEPSNDFPFATIFAGLQVSESVTDWRTMEGMMLSLKDCAELDLPASAYQSVEVRENDLDLTLTPRTQPGALDEDAREKFSKPSAQFESGHPEIIAALADVSQLPAFDDDPAIAIAHWVKSKVKGSGFSPADASALETLRSGRGDCTERAALAIALLRAQGMPARRIVGASYVKTSSGKPSFGFHSWVEVWQDDSWRCIDPSEPDASESARYISFHDPDATDASASEDAAMRLTISLAGKQAQITRVQWDGYWETPDHYGRFMRTPLR